jgi:DNA replication protein DnaC
VLIQQTINALRDLRLTGMAEAYLSQACLPDVISLPFDDRLALIVDQETTYRKNRRLAKLIRDAKFRMSACLEDIDYTHLRGLDKTMITGLRTCQWIDNYLNILITGPTGVGKTYLACALGNLACRNGFSTRYYRIDRLITLIGMSKGDGTYPNLIRTLAKTKLLIIDDFGLEQLSQQHSRYFLDILDDRTGLTSTIVSSQLTIDQWHQTFDDPTLADAILDRLVHSAHKIAMTGESMRKLLTQL